MPRQVLTKKDWDVIRDALEMRHREACELKQEMEEIDSRMALTFGDIAERANETLTKLEEMELV